MKRQLMKTNDGSMTIHLPEINEQYHSKHGALQEAQHVFIKMGLEYKRKDSNFLNVLEIGFGTGLNCLLTLENNTDLNIHYTAVEAYPVSKEEWQAMDYGSLLDSQESNYNYKLLHESQWGKSTAILSNFILDKQQKTFQEINDEQSIDLIYFDAFGPRVQPELWTEEIFKIMYKALKEGGALTTYCAKGSVRRAMQDVGFTVERLEGPPGKREMLRATKC